MVHFYSADEKINPFAIGYMINPLFHETSLKWFKDKSHNKKMEPIRDVIKKKDTCVISLIIFYDNKGKKPKKCIGCYVVSFIV